MQSKIKLLGLIFDYLISESPARILIFSKLSRIASDVLRLSQCYLNSNEEDKCFVWLVLLVILEFLCFRFITFRNFFKPTFGNRNSLISYLINWYIWFSYYGPQFLRILKMNLISHLFYLNLYQSHLNSFNTSDKFNSYFHLEFQHPQAPTSINNFYY